MVRLATASLCLPLAAAIWLWLDRVSAGLARWSTLLTSLLSPGYGSASALAGPGGGGKPAGRLAVCQADLCDVRGGGVMSPWVMLFPILVVLASVIGGRTSAISWAAMGLLVLVVAYLTLGLSDVLTGLNRMAAPTSPGAAGIGAGADLSNDRDGAVGVEQAPGD